MNKKTNLNGKIAKTQEVRYIQQKKRRMKPLNKNSKIKTKNDNTCI